MPFDGVVELVPCEPRFIDHRGADDKCIADHSLAHSSRHIKSVGDVGRGNGGKVALPAKTPEPGEVLPLEPVDALGKLSRLGGGEGLTDKVPSTVRPQKAIAGIGRRRQITEQG
jgi:hypothetical protein